MFVPVLALGLAAGVLTTIAGLGGGQLLVLSLAAVTSPHDALLLTAPALMVGNVHRGSMLREHVAWPSVIAFSLGAIPGGLVGGLVTSALPAWVLHALMGIMTLVAVGRSLFKPSVTAARVPPVALAASGFGLGVICASSSGAGLILAPLLLLAGLHGLPYVATAALCAAALHAGRLIGYGLGGMLGLAALLHSAGLAVAIIAGNHLGERLRTRLPQRAEPWIEQGTLVACVALVIVGAV